MGYKLDTLSDDGLSQILAWVIDPRELRMTSPVLNSRVSRLMPCLDLLQINQYVRPGPCGYCPSCAKFEQLHDPNNTCRMDMDRSAWVNPVNVLSFTGIQELCMTFHVAVFTSIAHLPLRKLVYDEPFTKRSSKDIKQNQMITGHPWPPTLRTLMVKRLQIYYADLPKLGITADEKDVKRGYFYYNVPLDTRAITWELDVLELCKQVEGVHPPIAKSADLIVCPPIEALSTELIELNVPRLTFPLTLLPLSLRHLMLYENNFSVEELFLNCPQLESVTDWIGKVHTRPVTGAISELTDAERDMMLTGKVPLTDDFHALRVIGNFNSVPTSITIWPKSLTRLVLHTQCDLTILPPLNYLRITVFELHDKAVAARLHITEVETHQADIRVPPPRGLSKLTCNNEFRLAMNDKGDYQNAWGDLQHIKCHKVKCVEEQYQYVPQIRLEWI